MNIEHRLIELVGATGKKLHTGRSRNDQVATDIRLHLRNCIDTISEEGERLLSGLATLALEHSDTLMPGFTHLQAAQPITFGHHLMAWFAMLERDLDRLQTVADVPTNYHWALPPSRARLIVPIALSRRITRL